ncbi:Mutator protein MutT [Legionella quinlivanii]|uniref:8-oxo-dGTP diphosphatase n=1 Tax=Legionella quinlivanii TaxID=45073 RepID=A0A0W0XTX6_9GAMM|nr:(deoxy)nucleoside triphosphate pyrophosphohydrolase [Legionella quinlivanii]KTD48009.1 Mutator protein MutT [Legionella quinlivanii]SEG21132.1 8-oxo-dGTPase [Legionella quinlivanii DSM 21216]STY11122.1 Mutator protein MutT [Legionella quinlivanii]
MKVVVAVIVDHLQKILITQRPLHVPHPGAWEFPGGKVEASENAADALVREVHEEVGLAVESYDFLGEVIHWYGEKLVQLQVFIVSGFSGVAICNESQLGLKWVSLNHLNDFEFPEANLKIIPMIEKALQ